MNEDERRQMAELEGQSLGGGADREAAQRNPHVVELKRRQALYPQKPVNALAQFFGSKEGPHMHGRQIPPEWYK